MDNTITIAELLFHYKSTKYPPGKFIKTATRDNHKLLVMANSWGDKYEVRGIDWNKDTQLRNTLLITDEANWPTNQPIYKYLYHPTRQIVLSVNDALMQFPKTDIAYIIVNTNDIPIVQK